MTNMAKKRSKTVKSPARRTKTPSRARNYAGRARAASKKAGMKWGEVGLSLIVGYEGGNLLQVPSQAIINAYPDSLKFFDPIYQASVQSGENFTPGETMNKTLGLAALIKAGYDVVKKKHLDDTDKNILIPYAIGTILDGPKTSSKNGAWN